MTARDPSAPEPHALHGLKLKAAVDWIEIKITLSRPSQPQHVRARMPARWGLPYVKALTDDPSRTATEFKFRVQDPLGPDQLMREAQALALPGDPAIGEADVTVTGLEVAVDAYPPDGDPQALALAALHLLRHHAQPPAGPPRITEPYYFGADALLAAASQTGVELSDKPGWFRVPHSPADALQALQLGLTINVGDQGDNYRARHYVKRHDTRHDTQDGEAYAPLLPGEHRARFEVTLQGAELPFTTIGAWRGFRFETLAQRFALVRATPADGLQLALQDRALQLGRPDSPGKRTGHRRLSAPRTERDTVTNEAIRVALRALTRAQKTGRECGNSDTK